MKAKRNKRVERKRAAYAARVFPQRQTLLGRAGERMRTVVFRYHVHRPGRRPKSVLALLEQDALVQAERLRRLEEAIMEPFQSPALQAVLVTEGTAPAGSDQTELSSPSLPRLQGGRVDYQQALSAQRIRRRLIS